MSERVAQVRGDEHRHPRLVDVAGAAHDVHTRKLGVRVAREMGVDPRLGPRGWDREGHQLHAGDSLGREHQGPAGRHRGLTGLHPGLLEQFPPRAGLEIDRAVEDVGRVRRPGGKINLSGAEGMEAISPIRKAPSAPRSAAIEKQLSTGSPGKPNSSQAR